MIVVVCLRDIYNYPDRLPVFFELSKRVNKLYLLTEVTEEDDRAEALKYPNLTFVEVGQKNFAGRACNWLDQNLSQLRGPVVVHSTFGYLVRFFETHCFISSRNFRFVHSQYTANHDWFNSVRHQDYPLSFNYLSQRIMTFWRDRRMALSADGVLVMCEGHRERVAKAHNVPINKIHAVPSEVDVHLFRRDQLNRQKRRQVIFVGTCFKNKGLDVLFEAMGVVWESAPDIEFSLYGSVVKRQKEWFSEALRVARGKGKVSVHGKVSRVELREAFARSDLMVSPSRFEGSPRAVREALASGCPALLSSIPGHISLDPTGSFIDYEPSFSPRSWAARILKLLDRDDETWLKVARAGIEHMHVSHNHGAVADALLNTYQRLF